MAPMSREEGFTLPELLISTAIVLMALGGAMSAFISAVNLNQATTQLVDANQNLRAGTNLLIRDLLQAARGIPTGGIPIPSGAGSQAISRPSPPGLNYSFDNVNSDVLPALIAGAGLGPVIAGATTDMITILMTDPLLAPLSINTGLAGQATLAADGSSINIGGNAAWFAGDPLNGVFPVAPGNLLWISNANGSTLQTVTRTNPNTIFFDVADPIDRFNLNQPVAAQGSVTQIVDNPMPQGLVTRVIMLTYYVDAVTAPGTPRLTRVWNFGTPQALAGVVEDLDIAYDLVDGVTNPTGVVTFPFVLNGVTYSANQVRKVNLHIGVRSDVVSTQSNDFLRNHMQTSVSIRSLAFVDRYQ